MSLSKLGVVGYNGVFEFNSHSNSTPGRSIDIHNTLNPKYVNYELIAEGVGINKIW